MYRRTAWRSLLVLLLGGLLVSPLPAAESELIRYSVGGSDQDRRYGYFVELLQLALEQTREDYGPYRLTPSTVPISQERGFALVKRGEYLDVVWGMTSVARETETRPVRIPLMKGLLGYRVMLVRPQQLEALSQVRSLEQLAAYTAVQGTGWPDTAILRASGLPVVTSTSYESLFGMVRSGRVDYFPRSVGEVWLELDSQLGEGLVLNPALVLRYFGPTYFFVAPEDERLAERLELGLRRAIADGGFDRLFYSRPELRQAAAFLRQGGYRLLDLQDPEGLDRQGLQEPKLWFQLPPDPSTPADVDVQER